MRGFAPQYQVDVKDIAKLHRAALTYADVQSERLFGYAEPFNFNKLVHLMRKINPNKELPEDVPGLGEDLTTVSTGRSVALLRSMGQPGWKRMLESLKETCVGVNA